MGIFWKRGTSQGALSCLIFGSLFGSLRLALELSFVNKELDGILGVFVKSNFLHFGVFDTFLCLAVYLGVSFFTEPKDLDSIKDITWDWSTSFIWRRSQLSNSMEEENKPEQEGGNVTLDEEGESVGLVDETIHSEETSRFHRFNWVAALMLMVGIVAVIIVFR